MKKSNDAQRRISKRQINLVARVISIILLALLTLSAPLIAWGLLSGGLLFGIGMLFLALAPISVEAINKLYPGKDLPLLVKILEITFLAWYLLNILRSFLLPGSEIIFWIMLGLYGLVVCAAVYRVVLNIKEGDRVTRARYAAGIVGLLAVFGAAAVLIIRADLNSRQNYSQVFDKATEILAKSKAVPSVLQTMPLGGPYSAQERPVRGNGLLSESENCGSDVNCPEVTQDILVQLRQNDEKIFFNELLKTFGKPVDDSCVGFDTNSESAMCYMQFMEGNYRVMLSLNRADPYHHGAPSPAEGESVWRYLVVTVYR